MCGRVRCCSHWGAGERSRWAVLRTGRMSYDPTSSALALRKVSERMRQSLNHVPVVQAIHNNAVWCDTICRTHGHAGEFLDGIWLTRHPAPPFYPNAVTLAGARATAAQLAAIRSLLAADLPGAWAVKDSWGTLDLTPLGFGPLFEATWIGRVGTLERPGVALPHLRWQKLHSATELGAWEAAWRGAPSDPSDARVPRIFLPQLLTDDTIAVIAAYHQDRIVAGAIANQTGEVIGLSNVFVAHPNAADVRAGCLAMVMDLFPALPIVGYESGDDLAAFLALGFQELGPLRIWGRATGSA